MRRFILVPALVLALAGQAAPATLDIVAQVSQTSYSNYLDNILYTHSGDNRGLGGAQHDLARDNIFNTFSALQLGPALDAFTYSGATYYNVVATWPGLVRPGDVYVVGAHYDSAGTPGADDNASGVAGVLEAARVLTQFRFEATLIFIAFDREEQGLYGSRAYVDNHPGQNVKGMVSLDMIAHNAAPGVAGHDQAAIYGAAASAAFRTALAGAVSTYSGGLTAVDRGTALDCCSDQRAFEEHGFPAALLIEDSGNTSYHQPSDSVNNPGYIDYQFATRMARSAVGFLADGADEVPEPGTALSVVAVILVLCAARRRPPLHG